MLKKNSLGSFNTHVILSPTPDLTAWLEETVQRMLFLGRWAADLQQIHYVYDVVLTLKQLSASEAVLGAV